MGPHSADRHFQRVFYGVCEGFSAANRGPLRIRPHGCQVGCLADRPFSGPSQHSSGCDRYARQGWDSNSIRSQAGVRRVNSLHAHQTRIQEGQWFLKCKVRLCARGISRFLRSVSRSLIFMCLFSSQQRQDYYWQQMQRMVTK